MSGVEQSDDESALTSAESDSGDERVERVEQRSESRYDDLGTVDISGTTTIDLYDRVDEILDEQLPSVRDDIEAAQQTMNDHERGSEEWFEARNEREDAREREQTLEHTARVFHTAAERWGGSEFVVKTNLAFHEVQSASDDIAEMTLASGKPQEVAGAKEGAYQLRVLMFGIEQSPPGAPEPNDDAFPWQVGMWLYQQFDEVNSRGDWSLGNSSSTAEDQTE